MLEKWNISLRINVRFVYFAYDVVMNLIYIIRQGKYSEIFQRIRYRIFSERIQRRTILYRHVDNVCICFMSHRNVTPYIQLQHRHTSCIECLEV